MLFHYRSYLRGTRGHQEDQKGAQEVKEVPEAEGFQAAEEVHAAAAARVQAQVLHADSADAGRPRADRGHHGLRGLLLRPLCRGSWPPEEQSWLTKPAPFC